MNKKMRELLAKIKEKNQQARKLQDEGNFNEAKKLIGEIKDLQTAYDNEKMLFEVEKHKCLTNQRTKQKPTASKQWQRLH